MRSSLYPTAAELGSGITGIIQDTSWRSKLGYSLYYGANLFYALLVSVMYSGYNLSRVKGRPDIEWLYFGSSFDMNFPMSWLFSMKFFITLKRLCVKRELLFFVENILAFLPAVATTFAGIEVAFDSTKGLEQVSWLAWLLVFPGKMTLQVVSSSNTFLTRYIGSVYLIHDIVSLFKHTHREFFTDNGSFYQFQMDLDRYGDQISVPPISKRPGESDDALLSRYAEAFYKQLIQQQLRPGYTPIQFVKKAVQYTLTAALLGICVFNFMPLWIKMTENGLVKLSQAFNSSTIESLSNSTAFTALASPSNEFFYINSGLNHLGRLFDLTSLLYIAGSARMPYDSKPSKVLAGLATVALVILPTYFLAYVSGAGYAQAALGAMADGFGAMADTLWFSWMGWWTNLFLPEHDVFLPGYEKLIQTAAGAIVNGGAYFAFLLLYGPTIWSAGATLGNCVKNYFFPDASAVDSSSESVSDLEFVSDSSTDIEAPPAFTAQEAKQAMEQAIEYGEFSDKGQLRNTINTFRKKANPYQWFSCAKVEDDEEIALGPINQEGAYGAI